jgi:hypothetical protein
MPSAARATGKDIILDILDNMRAYREELLYSSMVPTAFEVHLHPQDYERLHGIFPAIAAEARRALDEELNRLNRRVGPQWLRKLTQPHGLSQPAQDTWTVTFFRDENEELQPGEIVVDSQLTVPQMQEAGSGTRTRRITTSRIGNHTTSKTQTIEAPAQAPAPQPTLPIPPIPLPQVSPAAPSASSGDATTRTAPAVPPVNVDVFAVLSYEDKGGHHVHPISQPQLVIGRGGAGYWVDVQIDAAPDVSREHIRLRRDTTTGRFFIKDMSLYGTTVNGERIASSIDTSNGGKRDLGLEVPLPPVARIGLADMVFLDFRLAEAS